MNKFQLFLFFTFFLFLVKNVHNCFNVKIIKNYLKSKNLLENKFIEFTVQTKPWILHMVKITRTYPTIKPFFNTNLSQIISKSFL